MKKWLVLSFVTIFLAGCSFFESAEEKIPNKELTYLALGDSLTEGIGDEENKDGYAGRLSNDMENWHGVKSVTYLNEAKKGRRSDQMIAQLKSGDIDAALKKADIISFTMGGNDIMKVLRTNLQKIDKEPFDVERVNYKARYQEIFDLIRTQNKDALIVAIGFYNPFVLYADDIEDMNVIMNEWNGDMQKIVEQDAHAIFVKTNDLFAADVRYFHSDYFHPNAKGYVMMEKRIINTLYKKDIYTLSNQKFALEERATDE